MADGSIRWVRGTRGVRIPRGEIDRLLHEGIPKPGKRRKPPRSDAEEAQAIRDIVIQ